MSQAPFSAPITPVAAVADALREQGHAVLDPAGFAAMSHDALADLERWRPSWDALPLDAYLRDGGRYRRRRHSCFTIDGTIVTPVPHRAHWQPLEYNALHGGIERWFEPIELRVTESHAWLSMLRAMGALASSVKGPQTWYLEAHQFRIDTTDGIGRPTPEGAHRDGVDFVGVVMVGRDGIKGGETRVFDADGPTGLRFTLVEPWSCLLLDDAKMIHESTPIQPLESHGHRDTLVLTLRAGGFQGPAAT